MKKILCAALAAVMVGSLAVGCGEKKETSGQSESSDVNMRHTFLIFSVLSYSHIPSVL